jgi:hypothetical protein
MKDALTSGAPPSSWLDQHSNRVYQRGDENRESAIGRGISTLVTGGTAPLSEAAGRLLPKMHRGGKVRKSGAYRLLRGERVIPASKRKDSRKSGRR